jgi:hypothetical protein
VNEVEIIITGKNVAGPAFKEAQRDADKLGRNLNGTERDAKQLGRELNVVFSDADRLGKAFNGTERDAAKLGRELKTVDRDSHEAGRAMDSASRNANQLGNNFEEAARDAGHLERQLLETKAAMAAFAVEFDKTGSSDALAGFRKAKSELSQLQQVAKTLAANAGGIGDALKNVLSGGGNLFQKAGGILGVIFDSKNISKALSSVAGPVIDAVKKWPMASAIVAGIIVGAPLIAAAITTVFSAAAVAGGILIAIRDARVKDEFASLGKSVMADLAASAAVFKEPLIATAHELGRAFKDLPIRQIFAEAVKDLDPLIQGLIRFTQQFASGWLDVVTRGHPVIVEFGRDLDILGGAFKSLLGDIADSGPGAAKELHILTLRIADLTAVVGTAIKSLSWLADIMGKLDEKTKGFATGGWIHWMKQLDDFNHGSGELVNAANSTTNAVTRVAEAGGEAAVQFDELNKRLNQVTVNADTLAGAMVDKVMGATLSMDHAVLSFNESLTHLDDNFKKGHLTLDITKAKGQQLREAVLASVQANLQEYDTLIKLGMGADQAAAAYDANTGALERQLQKLGLTKGQIDDLIGKYRGVPDKVNTDIAVNGLTSAIADLTEMIRLINGIPKHTTAQVDYIEYRSGERDTKTPVLAPSSGGSVKGTRTQYKASGGVVGAMGGGPRSGMTWVGEQGPELVRLPYGSTVMPHGQSEQMAAAMAGAPTRPAAVTVNFTGQTDTVFATAFMKLVRTGQIQLSAN